ncbi:lipoprotein-releasing ABC transporter permease subunit [Gammaproteobacteria bacterium]|nr:lipoprotein-releasing ABC transporter permease subunit [Gammaproteobacteria bacterium]
MRLPFKIARRYTSASRKNSFISFISRLSVVGISLGVAVLIIVLSVMNGFEKELKERILGTIPHASLYVNPAITDWQKLVNTIEENKLVTAAAPFINLQAMLSSSVGMHGVLVSGIDPQYENKFSIVGQHIQQGSLDTLKSKSFNIVIGSILATNLGLNIGDKITIILPQTNTSILGVMPRIRTLTVTGIFNLGAQLDANLAYINIKDAALLSKKNNYIDGVHLKFHDLFSAPQLVENIASTIPAVTHSSNWTYSYGNLFQSIAMERRMISLLLFLIIAVAAFNMVSNLMMMVAEKRGDIAILRTMGMHSRSIMAIFIYHGSMVGVFGIIIGVILGLSVAFNIDSIISFIEGLLNIQFLNTDTYFINYFPTDVRLENVIVVSSISLLISILVTIYPAYRASQTNPCHILKND